MGFHQIGRQAKMATWISNKKYTAPDLDIPILCQSFWIKLIWFSRYSGQTEKVDKNHNS